MLLSFAGMLAMTMPGLVPVEHFHWQGKVAAGQSIEIQGTFGSIRADPAEGDRAEVTAYQRGELVGAVPVDLVQSAGGVLFVARSAGNTRIDYVVSVPRGVRFVGRTVNGSVEARCLGADTSAYTVNGNVTVSTAGAAQAETVNGSITAHVGRVDPRRNLRFATVNGRISLEMPRCAQGNIHAHTVHGVISSDLRGAAGKTGPHISVSTVNGDIWLHRSVGTEL